MVHTGVDNKITMGMGTMDTMGAMMAVVVVVIFPATPLTVGMVVVVNPLVTALTVAVTAAQTVVVVTEVVATVVVMIYALTAGLRACPIAPQSVVSQEEQEGRPRALQTTRCLGLRHLHPSHQATTSLSSLRKALSGQQHPHPALMQPRQTQDSIGANGLTRNNSS